VHDLPSTIERAPGGHQLRDWVASELRTAISEGRLQPGEWLRQERLSRELGVSHMPVREALKQLAAEGLIEYLPYRGMRVVEFSLEDIEDVYAVRAGLEGRAAAAAATRIGAEELADLARLVARLAQTQGVDQLAENRAVNRSFHETVYRASRRAYLIRTLDQIWSWFPTMFLGIYPSTARLPVAGRDTDVEEHEAILDALRDGARDLAGRLMAEHVRRAGDQLVAVLREDRAANTESMEQ
jgi:DNA-binding GntR family transcriptional regulator